MKLHFRILGDGEPLIVMHGVFGSSDNWQSVGKELAEQHKVYLVDMRNHGKSPHSEQFDYDVMAQDIIELMDDEGLDRAAILGHSMGGKVAMSLAMTYPSRVSRLVVVDIAPKSYPPHHQQIFEGFRSVALNTLTNRKEADEQMAKVISNIGVRQFILKNLERDDQGQFQWKLNLDVIERKANEVGSGLSTTAPYTGETLFIAGGNSDYILEADHASIQQLFPEAKIERIAGAGHWVHAERPQELKALVSDFLK